MLIMKMSKRKIKMSAKIIRNHHPNCFKINIDFHSRKHLSTTKKNYTKIYWSVGDIFFYDTLKIQKQTKMHWLLMYFIFLHLFWFGLVHSCREWRHKRFAVKFYNTKYVSDPNETNADRDKNGDEYTQ